MNKSPKTNIFQNVKNPIVQSILDIDTVLDDIKTGRYKVTVEYARRIGESHQNFTGLKTTSPTFTPHGTFDGWRKVENLDSMTEFIYLDVDEQVNPIVFHELPFVYSCWKSFSGTGYGLLVSVSGLTTDNFQSSWSYLNDYFGEMGINLDSHSKDLSRQCIISYDPNIYINESVIPLSMPVQPNTVDNYPTSLPLPDYPVDITYHQQSIKFNTTLEDYGNNDYIIIKEGKEYRTCYLPNIIEVGKRNHWLSVYTSSLLFNNPSLTSETIKKIVYKANKKHCNPPLPVSAIDSMVKWSYKTLVNGQLKLKTRKKKIWINPDKKLDRKQKRRIIGQVSGLLRKQATIESLIEIYNQLSNQYPKVTQKLLVCHSTKQLSTIKKYWKEIKDGVLYH